MSGLPGFSTGYPLCVLDLLVALVIVTLGLIAAEAVRALCQRRLMTPVAAYEPEPVPAELE